MLSFLSFPILKKKKKSLCKEKTTENQTTYLEFGAEGHALCILNFQKIWQVIYLLGLKDVVRILWIMMAGALDIGKFTRRSK